MTTFTKPRIAFGLAAISLAVLGCTAISAETAGVARTDHAQAEAPVACTLTAETSGRNLILEPVVRANEAVSGIYQLRVEGPGTRMNQGGPFALRAGQTVELGRMTMSGSATDLEAELTLTIDGRSYACPTDL